VGLKDVPSSFAPNSEEDLRFAVASFFRELGFNATEMSFEDRFTIQLGHNLLSVEWKKGREHDPVTGRSDVWLTRNGRSLAIVETKRPDHKLTDDDAWQGISYARLIKEVPPFVILTNGRDTRVYETLAAELRPLEEPTASSWYKGSQQIPTVADDLRYLAARTLIGVNPGTLRSFCQSEVNEQLADIRGPANERKPYIPEVYVERAEIMSHFDAWLLTDLPCFALVGESGFGKTNIMANTAEASVRDRLTLFYRALRLPREGFLARLTSDFEWEFHQQRGPAYVAERFDAIARVQGQLFTIFLDGLDEFPGDREVLKAELLDLVSRLRGTSIRFCVSCKTYDWADFVIENGQSYNRLATSTYPAHAAVLQPNWEDVPDPKRVGVMVGPFTDAERDAAYSSYQSVFVLQGSLRGDAVEQSRSPWLLRLAAEVYGHSAQDVPSDFSGRELFALHLRRHFPTQKVRAPAERILAELAKLSIQSARRVVTKGDLSAHVSWVEANATAFEHLVRVGMIVVTEAESGIEQLTFNPVQLRALAYTMLAEEWPAKPPTDVAKAVATLASTQLGFEVIEFYLTGVDRGKSPLLEELAALDLPLFAQATEEIQPRAPLGGWWDEREHTQYIERLVESYSSISRRYFPELVTRMEPGQSGDVGALLFDGSYSLRIRTPEFPELLTTLDEAQKARLRDPASRWQQLQELKAGTTVYSDLPHQGRYLPQKVAWDHVRQAVSRVITSRMLDESSAPALLRERAWDLLTEQPIRIMVCPPVSPFWQEMGFPVLNSVASALPKDLLERSNDLLRRFAELASMSSPQCARSQAILVRDALRLHHALKRLAEAGLEMEQPAFSLDEYFGNLMGKGLESARTIIETLLPTVLASYRALMDTNLSGVRNLFKFYIHSDASLLVQVSPDPHSEVRRSDYLTVSYAILPTTELPGKWLVYACEPKDSLALVPTEQWVLGNLHTSWGSRFGRAHVSLDVGERHIDEPDAYLSVTRYPSHHPVLDQVYQLIGNEAEYLFGGALGEWSGIEFGSPENDSRDVWLVHELNEAP
jgi:hypothetical protein